MFVDSSLLHQLICVLLNGIKTKKTPRGIIVFIVIMHNHFRRGVGVHMFPNPDFEFNFDPEALGVLPT
jgi:hypothetical protein